MRACVHNTTDGRAPGLERGEALAASARSRPTSSSEATGGRFVSPLERDGEIGAAVDALRERQHLPGAGLAGRRRGARRRRSSCPTTREIAPESRGNLFDNTEIEEALLLHVHALSDVEREEIAEQDPAVREMIERAARRDARGR